MKKINIRKLYYHARHRYFTLNNLVFVGALLIAASWAWGSIEVLDRNYTLQKEVDSKYRQQKLLELEVATLSYQKRYHASEEYQELAVRERLGLAKSGEKALILPENTKSATETEDKVSIASTSSKPSNTEEWINFLLGGNSQSLKK